MDPDLDLVPRLRGSLAMGASAYGAIGAAAVGALEIWAVAVAPWRSAG